MKPSLKELALSVSNLEAFINIVTRFPMEYLKTDEEKQMTKKELRQFYTDLRGLK